MKESYYIFSSGKLSKKNKNLRFSTNEGDVVDLKSEVIQDIYCYGEITMNTSCLNFLSKLNIPLHIFDYYGFYSGIFLPKETNISGEILIKQVEAYQSNSIRLKIATEILNGAIHNILKNLKYYQNRGKNVKEEIIKIELLYKKLFKCKTIEELMGIEGSIRKVYYSCWKKILNNSFNFQKRVKRPPNDIINSLISYLNSYLYSLTITEISLTKLNLGISFLHSPAQNRFSLALDISEIFKPFLVDRTIFSVINKNIISEKDFEFKGKTCYLLNDSKKLILKEMDRKLKKTFKHKDFNIPISYKSLIHLECLSILKFLNNEKEYQSFKMWW